MTGKQPILITGSHRSGSTWVGKIISTDPSVGYVQEPFHIRHSPGICGAKFDYWFTYVTKENESVYYEDIENTVEFRYNIIGALKTIRSRNDAKKVFKQYKTFSTYRSRNVTPLIKDPIAVLSAEWLAETFDMDVLVLIRHPAAFASSLKRLNWTHPFSHFLQQPLLMRDYLHPLEAQIREFANKEHNIIDQASLLWRIIHHVILKYRSKHEDWIFLRHEDISREPLHHFQDLFERFHLQFSEPVRRAIQETTDPSNPTEAPEGKARFLRRDSRSNIWNWKNRLTESEIQRIREQIEDVSKEFYSDSDW